MIISYKVLNKDKYSTVYDVLKQHFEVSARLLSKLKKYESIYLNGKNCNLKTPVNLSDTVSFSLDYYEDNSNISATQMDLNIIYEDDALLVLNKPPFMAIHPTSYHFNDTLSNGVKYYFDKLGLNKKIRPVNRLDRNTSGLVVFAKNEYVQEALVRQMANGIFKKKYIGIVVGHLEKSNGTISAPISRKENSIIERKIDQSGFPSITHYFVLEKYHDYSLVEFILETGRTHQIRVHSQYIGHPLIGDSLYGSESPLINRQALHSYYLSFIHPVNLRLLKLKSELPLDMKKLLTTSPYTK